MNQIQLIEYCSNQLTKVICSHGPESEYVTVAFFKLQAAKMGIPVSEMFIWANAESERLKKLALDAL